MADDIKCTVCKRDFDLEGEGGSQGFFGMIPVSFCPTCYSCLLDWVDILAKEKLEEKKVEKKVDFENEGYKRD